MIHYQLRCGAGHGFDGWFKDSAGFDAQSGRGLVACPECGGTDVVRALMAPSLGRKGRARAAEGPVVDESGAPAAPPASPPASPPPGADPAPERTAVMPDGLRAALQRMRAEVEKHCEDVGPAFAQEARKIHSGESDKRGIYGETTPEEAEALKDEGIEVARLPWVPRADG